MVTRSNTKQSPRRGGNTVTAACLTPQQAAIWLGVDVKTVRKLVRRGQVPVVPIGTKRYRIYKDDLLALRMNRRTKLRAVALP
jgi:excisionase family DNA binding protein